MLQIAELVSFETDFMISLKKALTSSVGQKFIMALTGLSLVIFVIMHLAGNLTLLLPTAKVFNAYAHQLASLGWLLIAAEVGLVATFLLHIATGICLAKQARQARSNRYVGGVSKDPQTNRASKWMPISGGVLLLFLVFHIWQFKYGPSLAQGYTFDLDGRYVRDLHRLVVETFQNIYFMVLYVVCLSFLGFHLSHGIWSAFQSLGATCRRTTKTIYLAGFVLSVLISLGFIIIPLALYFNIPGACQSCH